MLLLLAFLSFMSVTFMVEAMALGNALVERDSHMAATVNGGEGSPTESAALLRNYVFLAP